jgi:fructose-specific phosphotransferase system IIC component
MKTPKTSTVVPVLIAATIILAAAMSLAGQKAGTENQATSAESEFSTGKSDKSGG